MPAKTQTLKVKNQTKSQKVLVKEEVTSKKQGLNFQFPSTKYRPTKKIYLAILLIGLVLLITYKKSWFIAATVNGSPITTFELLDRLNKLYGSKTLSQMINDKIILNEAAKNRIVVSNQNINDRIAQVEKNFGGPQALDALLVQQGQNRNSLRDMLKVQLTIEKLYEKDATVSAQEVNSFIEQNKNQLEATDSAGQTKEATEILRQQKIGKIYNEKFPQLKEQAKIQIF